MDLSIEKLTNKIHYTVVRSNRRSVAIEVSSGKGVILRLPFNVAENNIPKIISQNEAWILETIEKQKNLAEKRQYSEEEKAQIKQSAKEEIGKLVEYYSSVMNLPPSAVKINFAKHRFGSCSPKNSLNFSAYLLEYPKEAIEYVVVHELAHIKYKNHSKKFYMLVEKYLPDYKNRIKMLKS